MQFSQATIAAFAALLPFLTLTNGHLLMDQPGVYSDGADPMPPLDPSGSNFPCSISAFNVKGTPPTLNPGDKGSIHLFGSAVHAGGSCQVSITYDQPPNRNSVWKALKSWETGCPVQADGNLPDLQDPKLTTHAPLSYTVPADLPSGKATIAWTWFNREGNREMYMRCHAASIGGSQTSTAGFDKLPHMFVANIAPAQCEVPRMVDLKFPNPAPETQGAGTGSAVGAGCGKPIGAAGNAPPAGGDAPKADNPPAPPAENKDVVTPPTPVVQVQTNTGGSCNAGQVQCSGSSWSMCVHGAWVNMGALAAGTDCSAIMGKRSVRFSEGHIARRAL